MRETIGNKTANGEFYIVRAKVITNANRILWMSTLSMRLNGPILMQRVSQKFSFRIDGTGWMAAVRSQ